MWEWGEAGVMRSIKDVMQGSRVTMRVIEQLAERADVAELEAGAERPSPFAPALASGTCPKCGGAGFVRHDVPVGHPQFGRLVKCDCRRLEDDNRRFEEMQRMSNLSQHMCETFGDFDQNVPGTREAYADCVNYSNTMQPQWLVISGPCGCGKTHLAAAIAHAALDDLTVLFAVVPDLLDQLRAAYAPQSTHSFDDRFRAIREVGLLILDDLGTENTTEWAREKLFQIINYRLSEGLPLVVTTNNVRRDKTTGRYIFTNVDERITSRLSDVRMVRHVHMASEDYRQRQNGYSPPAQRPPARKYT